MTYTPSKATIRRKAGTTGITTAGQSVVTAADAAAQRAALGVVIGTSVLAPNGNGSGLTGLTQSQVTNLVSDLAGKQPLDGTLTALAGLTTSADQLIYATGADTFALADLTSFIRGLLDDATADDARTTLGLIIGTDVLAPNGSGASLTGMTNSQFASGSPANPLLDVISTATNYNGNSGVASTIQTLTFPATGTYLVNLLSNITSNVAQNNIISFACGTCVLGGASGEFMGSVYTAPGQGHVQAVYATGSPATISGTSRNSMGSILFESWLLLKVTTAGTFVMRHSIASAAANAFTFNQSVFRAVKVA